MFDVRRVAMVIYVLVLVFLVKVQKLLSLATLQAIFSRPKQDTIDIFSLSLPIAAKTAPMETSTTLTVVTVWTNALELDTPL